MLAFVVGRWHQFVKSGFSAIRRVLVGAVAMDRVMETARAQPHRADCRGHFVLMCAVFALSVAVRRRPVRESRGWYVGFAGSGAGRRIVETHYPAARGRSIGKTGAPLVPPDFITAGPAKFEVRMKADYYFTANAPGQCARLPDTRSNFHADSLMPVARDCVEAQEVNSRR